jgi:hypothetical protein
MNLAGSANFERSSQNDDAPLIRFRTPSQNQGPLEYLRSPEAKAEIDRRLKEK